MHLKFICPNETFRDTPVTTFLNTYSKGLDVDQLRKIAADQSFIFNADFERKPGKAYLHLITTGDYGTYGLNNNGDGWPEAPMTLKHASANKECRTAGGLKEHHNSFTKNAHVYEEHYNGTKGGPELGNVVAECYNPVMHRGELIVEVDQKDWHDDLEKLASGDHIFWSIGAAVPYDICSVCLNKAATSNQYCDHIRYNKLGLTKEGRQIGMINDQPNFHDISKVAVPADRIAFTLRKVASGVPMKQVLERTGRIYVPKSVIDKLATTKEKARADILYKLAELEKRIIMENLSEQDEALADAVACPKELEDDVVNTLKDIPLDDILEVLNKNDVVIPPKAFVRIVIRKEPEEIPYLDEVPKAVENIFSDIQGSEDLTDILNDGSYMTGMGCPHKGNVDRMQTLTEPLSIGDEPVRHRIFVLSAGGSDQAGESDSTKTAAQSISDEAKYLAREYAKYQLSFLAKKANFEKYAKRIIIANKVR